jgi:hypothetical protein
MLPRKILNFRSLEWPFPAISWRNTTKGTSKNCVISGKFLIIFFEMFLKPCIFIIFHYICFNLSENVAKYSQVTKVKRGKYHVYNTHL